MAQNENVNHKNTLTFEGRVLEKIANNSIERIDGILELKGDFTSGIKDFFSSNGDETKGVNAEVGSKEVALDLEIVAEYGKNILTAFDKAVELITKNVEKMTCLKVVEVNMNVNDVLSRAEYEKSKSEEERKKAEERRKANQNGEYSDGSRVQ